MDLNPKLSELFPELQTHGNDRVTLLTSDHRKVSKGSVFFAIRGLSLDGHQFINAAFQAGALACVVEQGHFVPGSLDEKYKSRLVVVPDVRKKFGLCSAVFYGHPAKSLQIIGITGTNGKTTSTYILEKLLTNAGRKVAVIGTIENRFGEMKIASTHSTPDAIDLHGFFSRFLRAGADTVVMEVTSHGLEQHRVYGIEFEGCIFTNLTQDHLDYHHDMESYFRAKTRLFTEYVSKHQVIWKESSYGQKLLQMCKKSNPLSFGKKGSDLDYSQMLSDEKGIHGDLIYRGKNIPISTNLVGDFNIQNLAACVGLYLEMGFSEALLSKSPIIFQVPGRLEWVSPESGLQIFVDYAHTPDALEKALNTLRPLCGQNGRLVCVFGCGGDRDALKRPKMGAVAEKCADVIWVTSDNPRSEDPQKICEEVSSGIQKKQFHIEVQRAKAIEGAVKGLGKEDVLLIAGKGHETYQVLKSETIFFDDRIEAKKAIQIHFKKV